MLRLILRRLVSSVPLLLVVSFGVFSLTYLVPGDAAVTLAGGENATADAIEHVRQQLGLDRPFLAQYLDWLLSVASLDLGTSLYDGRPLLPVIADRVPVTLGLTAAALVVAVPTALILGVTGGSRPGTWVDRLSQVLTSSGIAVPGFWLALLLVSVFAVNLGWLPAFGYVHFTESPVRWAQSIILPAIALGVPTAAVLARQLRASLADTLQAQFVRTAWAKGATEWKVLTRHAFRNSAIPVTTVLGVEVGSMLGGVVIIEQIFALPGLGTYMITAILNQDVPIIQAVTLIYVVIYLFINLSVDIGYAFLNPKVRAR